MIRKTLIAVAAMFCSFSVLAGSLVSLPYNAGVPIA